MSKLTEPLMYMGGETEAKKDEEIKDCKHAAEEECTANCTYWKFTADGYNKGGTQSKQDRIGFVKKVYGILLTQLALTSFIIAASLNVDALRGCEYGAGRPTLSYESYCEEGENPEQKSLIAQLWIASAIGAIVCLLTLVCVPVGTEHDDDGQIKKLGKPIHMV